MPDKKRKRDEEKAADNAENEKPETKTTKKTTKGDNSDNDKDVFDVKKSSKFKKKKKKQEDSDNNNESETETTKTTTKKKKKKKANTTSEAERDKKEKKSSKSKNDEIQKENDDDDDNNDEIIPSYPSPYVYNESEIPLPETNKTTHVLSRRALTYTQVMEFLTEFMDAELERQDRGKESESKYYFHAKYTLQDQIKFQIGAIHAGLQFEIDFAKQKSQIAASKDTTQ